MKKIKLPTHKSIKKECDTLWSRCVHARAKHKSEISDKPGPYHAHHVLAKPNYRLRYELANGILLTAGEHKFGIHNENRRDKYDKIIRMVIKKREGDDIFDRLELLRSFSGKTNLFMVKAYLENKLEEYGWTSQV